MLELYLIISYKINILITHITWLNHPLYQVNQASLEQKLADYYAREEREPLKVFHFRPQLMDFERAEGQGFVEVLRPRSIYDLIDFSVRECIKREIKMSWASCARPPKAPEPR